MTARARKGTFLVIALVLGTVACVATRLTGVAPATATTSEPNVALAAQVMLVTTAERAHEARTLQAQVPSSRGYENHPNLALTNTRLDECRFAAETAGGQGFRSFSAFKRLRALLGRECNGIT